MEHLKVEEDEAKVYSKETFAMTLLKYLYDEKYCPVMAVLIQYSKVLAVNFLWDRKENKRK